MNALLELAARCEAATGPDRELECRVWLALSGKIGFESASAIVADLGQWQAPAYTASLDAAMTLVPPEHTIQLSDWEADVLRAKGPWQAIVLPMGVRGKMSDFTFSNRSDHCWSPALALTAASLRARASIAGDA